MQPLPHTYTVTSITPFEGNVTLSSRGLTTLEAAAPAEYGGPGDLWSPETFLVGAVSSCYLLTFRAIARSAGLLWERLDCHVDGILDKAGGATKFTEMVIEAQLTLAPNQDVDKAKTLLQKAEKFCLITNSLTAKISLKIDIQ